MCKQERTPWLNTESPPLSDNEQTLVNTINEQWNKDKALTELKSHLQIAVEVELATIPIYLYCYYSINRTPDKFPKTDSSRYADQAGALIMSVAVEEMLHMSLSSNILFALGQAPLLYQHSPGPYPTNLPGHSKLGPDKKPVEIPLAKFSSEQLWRFLEIEYPSVADAPPEGNNWVTIGQIYSYIRCIIESNWIDDNDFKQGKTSYQILPGNYSPNNIDTAYPSGSFDTKTPTPAGCPHSASSVAVFPNRQDSHLGNAELINIHNCDDALQAIATICFQGEGFDFTRFDDPSDAEKSHYYKFLTLQSKLEGYPFNPVGEPLPGHPKPPEKPATLYSPSDLDEFVLAVPDNPDVDSLDQGRRMVCDVGSALYQYMLILTETLFKIPHEDNKQKVFFNQALHNSMIWMLDKYCQALRDVEDGNGINVLSCPFDNIDLGRRDQAFGNLKQLCDNTRKFCANLEWYTTSGLDYYLQKIPTLPDVTNYWQASQFAGAPSFPSTPPAVLPEGADRHACMGLNSCRNQGRTLLNDCAGQGYCSTALSWNPADVNSPEVSDHTCHVLNDCAGQGGCGLYGTADEQMHPGANECRSLGSCATPINAERFSTDGDNQGKSVWLRAREVFKEKVWPELKNNNPDLPDEPPQVPGTENDPDVFKYGPTIEWIENEGGGMTACGASGMSGAGSCA